MGISPKEVPQDRFKIIGRNLSFERFRKGLTQAQLAELAGIADSRTVSKHEHGEPMEMMTLFAYASALGCPCEVLFDERKGSDAQILNAFERAAKLPKERREEYFALFGIV